MPVSPYWAPKPYFSVTKISKIIFFLNRFGKPKIAFITNPLENHFLILYWKEAIFQVSAANMAIWIKIRTDVQIIDKIASNQKI